MREGRRTFRNELVVAIGYAHKGKNFIRMVLSIGVDRRFGLKAI